jgi:very-short-patch-repair endonuclease
VGPGEPAVAAIATRQLNVVTRGQLLAAGVGRGSIRRRLESGRLHPRHRGVYLLGTPNLLPRARVLAAVLACGEGALASHRTAAVLWKMLPDGDGPIHVTLQDHDRRPAGIRVHRTTTLGDTDRDAAGGIPVTSPTRTLQDLAAKSPRRELERALNEAQILSLVDPSSPLLHHDEGPALTRSEAERAALALIERAGLPRPRANARVGPYEVDILWPDHRLIVEIDGYAFHSSRSAFERDHRKTAALQALDHSVIRVTWRWLTDEPHALVATLAAAIATRSPTPPGAPRRP